MIEKNLEILNNAFKEYYFKKFDLISLPSNLNEREFGYQKFNEGMVRHLPIHDSKELHLLLMTKIPSDIYCSNGLYSFPNLPMAEKDWKGAELIFDIDAKDLNLECKSSHSFSKCNSCQNIYPDNSICPKCGGNRWETISTACKNCIVQSKREVLKLIEVLTEDLGINKKDIEVYFSGNEGFHVYASNSEFQGLDSRERADLADYIMFNGVMPESLGINKQIFSKSSFPNLNEPGWRGRIAKEIFGSKSKRPRAIRQILSGRYEELVSKIENLKSKIGVRIDPKVTMDVHRIFRLKGSLNSKSGLSKLVCKNLNTFDPFTNACLIEDESTEIFASCPISFKLKNKKFGPYYNDKIEVPKYAAVYLMCKGLAVAA